MVEGVDFVVVELGTFEEWIHSESFDNVPGSAVASRLRNPQSHWREIGNDVAGN